jgi:hypothetical protein
MIPPLLRQCLAPLLEADRRLATRRTVASLMVLAAVIFGGLALWCHLVGKPWTWSLLGGCALFLIVGIAWAVRRQESRRPDLRSIARRVEEEHPDLQAGLLAALDQEVPPGGKLGFLQKRLLAEISSHARQHQWVRQVSEQGLRRAVLGQGLAAVLLLSALVFLWSERPGPRVKITESIPVLPDAANLIPGTLSVSPGDTEVEKGSRLIIEATFGGTPPAGAVMVMDSAEGELRLPLSRGLDDHVFHTTIPAVEKPARYRVEATGLASPEYEIRVFEFPVLVQADAQVTPPAYLQKPPVSHLDIRSISVMEGSSIDWSLRVNKPVVNAELFGEDGTTIALQASAQDPTILTATQIPGETQRYRVHLVDESDRANRKPPWITVTVNRNLRPELKVTFPGRDHEVSPLEELALEATVRDDVEVLRAGLSYRFRNQETEVVLAPGALPGEKIHPLVQMINFETLEAESRDLLVYHYWAEDRDASGELRRTDGDQYFVEVRFLEKIIREAPPQQGQPSESDGQAGELLKLQKDIVSAAWKLQRSHEGGSEFERLASDVDVVRQSQLEVRRIIDEAIEKAEDAELKQILVEAAELMDDSVAQWLEVLESKDAALIAAGHDAALAVFAKLLQANSREQQIALSKSASAGGSPQEKEQNLNLELSQKDLKYEETSAAEQTQKTAEQQENLAILNRLKELARRQEAIAEKIKDLENQMAQATPEEKEDLERQLKRLKEEQQQLLRDTDELAEKLDSEENRSRLDEQRQELAETREEIRETAENLEEGQMADAANSATRAQEQLTKMEEKFREKTSRRFAEEMRGLREAARNLTETQEALGEKLAELSAQETDPPDREAARDASQELAQELARQGAALEDVLENLKALSEEAKSSEPLLSDTLYEAIRQTMTQGTTESLAEARDLSFYNRPTQARTAERAAARGIQELAEGVTKAADKILGSESEALRMARSELEELIEQAQAESARLEGQDNPSANPSKKSPSGDPANQANSAETPKAKTQQGSGENPAEGQEAGKEPGDGNRPANGEETKPGEVAGQKPGEGAGEKPGEGQGKEAKPGEGKGAQPETGEGQGNGQQPGEGKGATAEQGQSPGQEGGRGEGQQPAEGQAAAGQNTPGESPEHGDAEVITTEDGTPGSPPTSPRLGARPGAGSSSSGGGEENSHGGPAGSLFFEQSSEMRQVGPITGEDYEDWSDRLAALEGILPQEELRNALARVRDEAKAMRIDFRRDNLPPAAASIRQRITDPLVELQGRLSDEIAKQNRENPIAPIDRDPVPSEFRDLVRRYYEELGAGR